MEKLLDKSVTEHCFNLASKDSVEPGKKTSIKEYSEEHYTDKWGRKLRLIYPHGPCLQLKGNKSRVVAAEVIIIFLFLLLI